MDDLWDITYDVWVYAQAARDAMRDGDFDDAKNQLHRITRRLKPVPADSPTSAAASDTAQRPASS